MLKELVLVVPIVPPLPDKKFRKEKSLGILPGVSAGVFTSQLLRMRFFSDHFKMICPISFKFKMHLDLLRSI